jgi:hypothetical protein
LPPVIVVVKEVLRGGSPPTQVSGTGALASAGELDRADARWGAGHPGET